MLRNELFTESRFTVPFSESLSLQAMSLLLQINFWLIQVSRPKILGCLGLQDFQRMASYPQSSLRLRCFWNSTVHNWRVLELLTFKVVTVTPPRSSSVRDKGSEVSELWLNSVAREGVFSSRYLLSAKRSIIILHFSVLSHALVETFLKYRKDQKQQEQQYNSLSWTSLLKSVGLPCPSFILLAVWDPLAGMGVRQHRQAVACMERMTTQFSWCSLAPSKSWAGLSPGPAQVWSDENT